MNQFEPSLSSLMYCHWDGSTYDAVEPSMFCELDVAMVTAPTPLSIFLMVKDRPETPTAESNVSVMPPAPEVALIKLFTPPANPTDPVVLTD
jgi:hypothetical protein